MLILCERLAGVMPTLRAITMNCFLVCSPDRNDLAANVFIAVKELLIRVTALARLRFSAS